jgi:hypothetical protein
MRIRRLALGGLLALVWIGLLVWFAASAFLAVILALVPKLPELQSHP